MTDEQKQMLANMGKPPEPQETFEDILMGAQETARGRKQHLIFSHALQLLKTQGEQAAKDYLLQRKASYAGKNAK